MISCRKKGTFIANIAGVFDAYFKPPIVQSQFGQGDRRGPPEAAEQRRNPERIPRQMAAESEE